ncbi:MAG: DUF721 domain-containing protein [Gilvibacter sp.]
MAKKRNREEQPLGAILKNIIQSGKLEKGLDKVAVRDAWNQMMGVAIAKYTTSIYLERDTLHVNLSSSVLREELSYGKQKIIDMLNEELGKPLVKKIILK